MRRKTRSSSDAITFLDLLFNMVLVFMSLFIMTFLHMNDDAKKDDKNSVAKAEYLITMTWDTESSADIDLYLQDPYENVVYFSSREKGLMHLDRDDLGRRNDTITLEDGTKISYKENREVITIRGIVEGEYICNVHAYSFHEDVKPVEVTVTIEKVNPKVRLKFSKTVTLEQVGHEATITRFTLGQDGDIVEFSDLEKEFTQSKPQTPNTGGRNEY